MSRGVAALVALLAAASILLAWFYLSGTRGGPAQPAPPSTTPQVGGGSPGGGGTGGGEGGGAANRTGPRPPGPESAGGPGELPFPYIYREPEGWNGRAIIFVHGLGASKEKWERDMEAFEALGYAVFAFDLPYHGERGPFPGVEALPEVINEGADEVVLAAEYLRARGAEEVCLVSRSLGSMVSAVALGRGADVDRAELLLASADLRYVFEHGRIREYPSWLGNDTLLREIDPLYLLPNYRGKVHFHCGLRDDLLTPEACVRAYDAASGAAERELFWHDRGHSMPLPEYFDEAAAFFSSRDP